MTLARVGRLWGMHREVTAIDVRCVGNIAKAIIGSSAHRDLIHTLKSNPYPEAVHRLLLADDKMYTSWVYRGFCYGLVTYAPRNLLYFKVSYDNFALLSL